MLLARREIDENGRQNRFYRARRVTQNCSTPLGEGESQHNRSSPPALLLNRILVSRSSAVPTLDLKPPWSLLLSFDIGRGGSTVCLIRCAAAGNSTHKYRALILPSQVVVT